MFILQNIYKRYQNEGRVNNLDFDRSVHTLIDFKSFMLTDNEMWM